MSIRKTALCAALGAVIAGPAHALNIDFSGTFNTMASEYFSEINWGSDNTIIVNAIGNGNDASTSGYALIQNAFTFGGVVNNPVMTYQLWFPVNIQRTVLSSDGGATTDSVRLTLTQDLGNPAVFAMFLNDPTQVTVNQTNGTGYGNLLSTGLFGAAVTGQTLVASGTVASIDAAGWRVSSDELSAFQDLGTVGDATVRQQDTRQINGSTNLNINITFQNDAYIRSDLVNAGLNLDVTLQDLSFNAPFNANTEVSAQVLGYNAFFGSGAGDTNQDGFCGAGEANDCDWQVQTGTNSKFFDQRVPEPASLALAGLALTLLGVSRRRKA